MEGQALTMEEGTMMEGVGSTEGGDTTEGGTTCLAAN